MENKLYKVSSSPHIRANRDTETIMQDVALALLPAALFGIYNFGYRAALIIIISVLTCVLSEYIFQLAMKKPITISDGSALVTGLLIALILPHTVPYWIPVLGGLFAIILVKQLYGGIGQNFVNPAIAARVFLTIAYTNYLAKYVVDGVTSVTPLAVVKAGGESVELSKLIWGTVGGSLGETSVVFLLIGAAYLVYRKVISLKIPLIYIATVFVFAGLLGPEMFDLNYMLAQVFSGGLIIGAFFMATDYVTSPVTPKGQIIFAFMLGLLTMLIRLYSGYPEGVSFAIMFMNLWVPIIEKFTRPTVFGKERKNERHN
ncbi:MAG: Na+-transporting NADH:ubiquinone oxidoreductase subunit [Clostridiales bacterium]|jgi:RnfABCDGE-type electron transport complex D subunit|nr:Na+-transporting NADH:ubiquinone oxidoreductase subunit [Clostridiales bacterium]